MIAIDHVTMRFGRATAVDDVSVAIPDGDSVALWGANGAGKTTLIRCVLGLLRFRGTIRVLGLDARRQGKRVRRLIGYVPQELAFYDDLGVGDAIAFFARLKGLHAVRGSGVRDVLNGVGLADHHRKRVRELSGGMKQRLALAVALLGDPPVLVLDEVTASLDAWGREELVSLLSSLRTSGRTMLFASHRVEEVTALANRVVLLDRGRVSADIPAGDLVRRLGHSAVLHIRVRDSAREQAFRLLKTRGFEPSLSGARLSVPVPAEQKAAPIRVLAEERIQVEDFEVFASRNGTGKEAAL